MKLEQWFDTRNTLHQIEHAIADQLQHTSEPMTLNEFYVMHYLAQAQGKPLTVNEISTYIGLSQCATSRMLHRFETSCQVIEKTQSPTDRRALQIKLTNYGNTLLQEAYSAVTHVLDAYTQVPLAHKEQVKIID